MQMKMEYLKKTLTGLKEKRCHNLFQQTTLYTLTKDSQS